VKFAIDEGACIDCGACRRYCPVDCIPYDGLQHRIVQEPCTGCTICYAVCPADAVLTVEDGRATPLLSFDAMARVRTIAITRGPR
jgi:Pyruvate/2-oxoacid:ferredoxin oxidoreductase delta subunit